jgi:hypothetical protein
MPFVNRLMDNVGECGGFTDDYLPRHPRFVSRVSAAALTAVNVAL